jgi:hypothetical protein
MLRRTTCLLLLVLLCGFAQTGGFLNAEEPVKTGEKRDTLLYIRTDPPGAKVLINGKEVGTSDGLFHVEPGTGTILVKLEGREPGERPVIIRANAITRVELSLDPKEGPKLEQKLEPKSRAEVDSSGPHFIANWRQGSVELVGVTNYPPTERSTWWKPDGSPIELGTFLPRTSAGPSHPRENSVSMLLRFKSLPPDTSHAWKTTPSAGWWADTVVDGQGKTIDGYSMLIPDFDETVERAGVRVGIDAGPWETVITQKPDRLGSSSFRRAGRESTIALLNAEARDRAGEDSTHVTLTSNEPYGEWRRRLVAVAKDDTEHATRIDYMGSNGTADFRGLPPSSIEEFRYQVRPFEWVEFQNVSLQRGQRTDVKVISSEAKKVTATKSGETEEETQDAIVSHVEEG